MNRKFSNTVSWLSCILAIGIASARGQDPLKIATVDMTILVKEYHEAEKARKEVDEKAARIAAWNAERLEDIRKANKNDRDEMDAARKKSFQEQKMTLAKKSESRMHEISAEIRRLAGEYAMANGYDLLLDRSGLSTSQVPFVLYAAGIPDATRAVLGKLNNEPATGTAAGDSIASSGGSPRIATVDVQEVFMKCPKTDAGQKVIDEKRAEIRKWNEGRLKAIGSVKKASEKKLLDDKRENELKERNRALNESMVATMRAILQEIRESVEVHAKAKGCNLVFDKSGTSQSQVHVLLFSKNAADLTSEVSESFIAVADKEKKTETPAQNAVSAVLDPKDTQVRLIGTWEIPNNGSILSFDAQDHITRRVDAGGQARFEFATAGSGEMLYKLAKDEKSGLLCLYIKEGSFENKRFSIIAISEDGFDALYDGDEPAAERTVRWKRTSKEPVALKSK